MKMQTNRQMFENNLPKSAITGSAAPKVLLTATLKWPIVPTLAIGLAKAGCDVSIVCPGGCPLPTICSIRHVFRHRSFNPLKSLLKAVKTVRPQIIIPCDDHAVQHLHELYAHARSMGTSGCEFTALIEKSLGSPDSYTIVSSRYDFLRIAREEGLRVPDTEQLNSESDLETWQKRCSYPYVLKADGTCGGYGVRVAHTPEQAEQHFSKLKHYFDFKRVFKRLLINNDPFLLWPWWRGTKSAISVQSYIEGRPANCAIFCWQGRVLAIIGVEVASTVGPTGRASVVRLSDNAEMLHAAERIAARLNLSGFFGLDFMIEKDTNLLWLIEMNPRPARPFHLQLGKGRDLIGALYAQLSAQPARDLKPVTEERMIAYFPDAWDSNSKFLPSSYHDIPDEDPGLVQKIRQMAQPNLQWRLIEQFVRMKSLLKKPQIRLRKADDRSSAASSFLGKLLD
jgi:hypothetical protein